MTQRDYVETLADLLRAEEAPRRRTLWRRSVGVLARLAVAEARDLPLEGVDPAALRRAVSQAQRDGLLEDWSFLPEPEAAAAAFELAAALPDGIEKHALGRWVVRELRVAAAPTYVVLASRLCQSLGATLDEPRYHARTLLAVEQREALGPAVDQLAAGILVHPRLLKRWVMEGASGTLAERRFAARLIECASRFALRQGAQRDSALNQVFEDTALQQAWVSLEQDREPMVWRFATAARTLRRGFEEGDGLHLFDQIQGKISLTQKSRLLGALPAAALIEPRAVTRVCRKLVNAPVFDANPLLRTSLFWGVALLAEASPTRALELLEVLLPHADLPAMEPLLVLFEQGGTGVCGGELQVPLRARLNALAATSEVLRTRRWLDALHAGDLPLLGPMHEARCAFAVQGAEAAFNASVALQAVAHQRLGTLARGLAEDPEALRYGELREVEALLLRSGEFASLLALAGENSASKPVRQLSETLAQLSVLPHVLAEYGRGDAALQRLVGQVSLRWLDGAGGGLKQPQATELLHGAFRALLIRLPERLKEGEMQRLPLAALARVADALVRDGALELSDALLLLATRFDDPVALSVIAEASMLPRLEHALRAYVTLCSTQSDGRECTSLRVATRFQQLATTLPRVGTPRVRALGRALVEVAEALAVLDAASSLPGLAGSGGLAPLSSGIRTLAQLTAGSRRRQGLLDAWELPLLEQVFEALHFAVLGAEAGDASDLAAALEALAVNLSAQLPSAFGRPLELVLRRLAALPVSVVGGAVQGAASQVLARGRPLPAWIPPSRILGGFYVQRSVGAGAGGSVFAAVRAEERDHPRALRFALKVPDVSLAAARSLDEAVFLDMFRKEARALLAMPEHPSLARFVTFDAGAQPKPILVMELVPGLSLDQAIEGGPLPVSTVLSLFECLAAGLCAMHEEQLAHLDIKPANIILRGIERADEVYYATPVLVDFGLSGRNLRPGCGTAEYTAPEIWTVTAESALAPQPADVYALACTLFEALTGQVLFEGDNEMAVVSAHLEGIESTVALDALEALQGGLELKQLLLQCLQSSHARRPTMQALRESLSELRTRLFGARPRVLSVRDSQRAVVPY